MVFLIQEAKRWHQVGGGNCCSRRCGQQAKHGAGGADKDGTRGQPLVLVKLKCCTL